MLLDKLEFKDRGPQESALELGPQVIFMHPRIRRPLTAPRPVRGWVWVWRQEDAIIDPVLQMRKRRPLEVSPGSGIRLDVNLLV